MPLSHAPEPLDGWFVLHDFRSLDWAALDRLGGEARSLLAEEAERHLVAAMSAEADHGGSSAAYRVIGHKADLLFLHVRPTVPELLDLERRLEATALARHARRPYSFFSVVELGSHTAGGKAEALRSNPALRARLEPHLPRTRFVSFYPMNKRRGERHNWFMLSQEERQELMRSHGRIGHGYSGRIVQIITGAMGLDDWEWGVTLFSDDPLAFKQIVYEMRFDEVSARYADFGPFFVGERLEPSDLRRHLLPGP